jgi:uncharacterized protein YuzE
VEVKYDEKLGTAYIYLIPLEERVPGVAARSVSVESFVLDLDSEGRLIGIESIHPEEAFRPSTLAQAGPS